MTMSSSIVSATPTAQAVAVAVRRLWLCAGYPYQICLKEGNMPMAISDRLTLHYALVITNYA